MALAERDHVAKAFLTDGSHEPFRERVEVRAARGHAHELHACGVQGALELGRVERVAIDEKVAGVLEEPAGGIGQVAAELHHPRAARVARDPGDVYASRLELDREKDEVAHQAAARQHLDAEEVRCRNGIPVNLEERPSRQGPTPNRCWLDAVPLEDAPDGRPTQVKAEVGQCTSQPRVSPEGVLPGHREKLGDLVDARRWPSRAAAHSAAVVLGGDQLPVPTQDRLRSRKRRDLVERLSPEAVALLRQQTSLGIREAKARRAKPLAKYAVFGPKVVNRIGLPPLQPTGHCQNEELQRSERRQGPHHSSAAIPRAVGAG